MLDSHNAAFGNNYPGCLGDNKSHSSWTRQNTTCLYIITTDGITCLKLKGLEEIRQNKCEFIQN